MACSLRWTYRATGNYPYPLFVSDSAGDVFLSEYGAPDELVAVRDGKVRWRRPLSRLKFPSGGFLNASLLSANLLVVSFGSTIAGLRTSDGHVVWSRNLNVDLAAEKRKAGLPVETDVATGPSVQMGHAFVTAIASARSPAGWFAAWITATASDGRPVRTTRIDAPVVRLAADGDRLYALRAEVSGDQDPIIVLPSPSTRLPIPPGIGAAVRGDEVVFDQDRLVTATIAPLPNNCPPRSPSCRPTPEFLTVTGYSSGQERWHFSHAVGLVRLRLFRLSDGAVLVVENGSVGRVSPEGDMTKLCEFAADSLRDVVGLVDGALIVARSHGVDAFALPGSLKLSATGWAMHGAGPSQDWAVRTPSHGAPAFIPFPGGVADPTTEIAYVQTDSGTTTALTLADGQVKWHTRSPAKPVGMWRGHVIVLESDSNALRVAQLDSANGAELPISQPIPLPSWLTSPLVPWGGPFSSEVRIEGDRASLTWEAMINGGSGGAEIRAFGAAGGAEVDLASGVVSLLSTQSLEGPRPPRLPSGGRPQTAIVKRRRFTLLYTANATLTARDVKSGKTLWTRQLWSISRRVGEVPPATVRP